MSSDTPHRTHLACRNVQPGGPRVSHGSMSDAHTPACMQQWERFSHYRGDFMTVTLEDVTCPDCMTAIFFDRAPLFASSVVKWNL